MTTNNKNIGIDRSSGTQLKSEGSIAQILFTVKEVCEKTGLTRKQLFDYKEIVKPVKYDKSGYKLYDLEGIKQLNLIAELRGIDAPLADIRLVIEGLKTKEEIVENQIMELNNRKSLIDHMIVLAQEMLTHD